jgi:hypothetical protein
VVAAVEAGDRRVGEVLHLEASEEGDVALVRLERARDASEAQRAEVGARALRPELIADDAVRRHHHEEAPGERGALGARSRGLEERQQRRARREAPAGDHGWPSRAAR